MPSRKIRTECRPGLMPLLHFRRRKQAKLSHHSGFAPFAKCSPIAPSSRMGRGTLTKLREASNGDGGARQDSFRKARIQRQPVQVSSPLAPTEAKGHCVPELACSALCYGDRKRLPEGFCKPDEARLGETSGFLTDEQRRAVTDWWLAAPQDANTPNWDLVSTCTVGGRTGLVIVEAKAHAGELKANDCCGASDKQNRERIEAAIKQASDALGEGWRLTADSHYQLSNRFAWAWKLASLGVPVILVYLGFLNVHEMGQSFASHDDWEQCLLAYGDRTVPRNVWKSGAIQVNDTPLIPLIRSAHVNTVSVLG